MLRPPSLLGQTSGFVPFGSGGSVHGDLDETVAPSSAPASMQRCISRRPRPEPRRSSETVILATS